VRRIGAARTAFDHFRASVWGEARGHGYCLVRHAQSVATLLRRMRRFLARNLARLSVGRKLLLIYLLDLSAVIFISGILINEKFIAIDFARKEILGNDYIAVVRDVLVDIARPRSARDAIDATAHVAALDAAERELDTATRRQLFANIQRIHADDLPVLPLFFRVDPFVIPRPLKGVVPTGTLNSSTLWVEQWRWED
jgi:hypothetical protein